MNKRSARQITDRAIEDKKAHIGAVIDREVQKAAEAARSFVTLSVASCDTALKAIWEEVLKDKEFEYKFNTPSYDPREPTHGGGSTVTISW